ncbi:MAG: hypothetical protein GYA55_08765 [SAR324 cluster bacterium]|uniref:Uncharacterized protein n=1 Tax=SAR324 cluster bacterium TaxID=2024889 RepID=A0A7X9FS21_9DELT|nr:hypothetical protein [SAR324 cluster bacterium]
MNERLISRGLYFDLFAFIGNIVIVPPLIEMAANPNGFSRFFGFALIAAALAYALGLTLKSATLRARLYQEVEEPEPAFFWYFLLFVLSVMHWGLFLTCFSIGMESLGISLAEAGPFGITIFFIGGSIPTTLTLVAVLPSENQKNMQSRTASIKERIGDCLLFFGTNGYLCPVGRAFCSGSDW